jgi:adenylate cyclase, class 2
LAPSRELPVRPIAAGHSFARVLSAYTACMIAVETEVKFRVTDAENFSRQLERSGFHCETPRSFESNTLWDTPDRTMRSRTEILRIRSYAGRTVLTHKRLPDSGPGEDRHKHRVETETEVADGSALAEVFRSLGLTPAFRYEKWRSEWSDGEGHCVVDETPIGTFAELEGMPEWIDRAAAQLGVASTDYITASYGRLFEQWCAEHGSNAADLTFAAIGEAMGVR